MNGNVLLLMEIHRTLTTPTLNSLLLPCLALTTELSRGMNLNRNDAHITPSYTRSTAVISKDV